MSRFQQLQNMIGRSQRDRLTPEEEQGSFLESAVDYLGRPNAAIKSGVNAFQQNEPVLDAMYKGLTSPSDQAPSGDQIASKFGESYGIENPMVLAGLSTVAEMADVPGLAPFSKGSKMMRAVGKLDPSAIKKVPGMAKTGESLAEVAKKTPDSEYGRVLVTPDRPQPGISRQTLQDRVGRENYDKIIKRFPHLKNAMTQSN